jgi:hypothetical protein
MRKNVISRVENVMNTFKGARSKSALFGAFLASAIACFGAPFQLTPDAKRDMELQPGVALIVVSLGASLETSAGQITCTGTIDGSGFLYRPDGYLITNGHVVQLANVKDDGANAKRVAWARDCLGKKIEAVRAKLSRENLPLRVGKLSIADPVLQVILDNNAQYQGEIKAYSDPIDDGGKDVAIVKIDRTNLATVGLGNSTGVNVGDQITVIGYPGAAIGVTSRQSIPVPTVTTGRISAVNKQVEGLGTPVLQTEAAINPGNSGGPAFDSSGRVIGIATFTARGAQGLNYLVPIDTALEFVRQAGSQPERGAFDQVWHDALDAYANQKWAKAHELMGRVLEIMPDQPDAKRLQLEAGNAPPETNSTILVAVGGGTLAVLLAIGGFMIARRGSGKPLPALQPLAAAAAGAVAATPAVVLQAHPSGETFGSLQISNGPLAGNRFTIPKSGLMIGRDPSSCAVVLPGDTVGKEHAWVVPLDNGVALIDRNSVNGTYVNSTESPRVNKVVLKDGDRIFVGRKNPTEIMYFRQ